jgi:cytochrome c-type biogenesis protein CcmH
VFWIIAAAAVFLAALITLFPLLRGKTFWQPAGLALIFIIPATTLWIYQSAGTPEAIGLSPAPRQSAAEATNEAHAQNAGDMDTMLAGLRARLEANPDDLDGWMLLARSYRSQQRYAEAAEVLEKANSLAPDNAFVMVELAETWVFISPDGKVGADSLTLLQRALTIDPSQQKAMFLLGVAAAQAGELEYAIEYWETLLADLEPDSPVAQSVQSQINQARMELAGSSPEPATDPVDKDEPADVTPAMTAAPELPADEAWTGSRVVISRTEEMPASVAANAVLYVMVRSAGPAMGPPIGVRRIAAPSLPLEITITDQDSMMAERKISFETDVQFQARLSLTGSPAASSGDWQSGAKSVSLGSNDTVELVLDQQVE